MNCTSPKNCTQVSQVLALHCLQKLCSHVSQAPVSCHWTIPRNCASLTRKPLVGLPYSPYENCTNLTSRPPVVLINCADLSGTPIATLLCIVFGNHATTSCPALSPINAQLLPASPHSLACPTLENCTEFPTSVPCCSTLSLSENLRRFSAEPQVTFLVFTLKNVYNYLAVPQTPFLVFLSGIS